ncbi:MAG: hypothetical protein KGP35_06555 [Bacteroidetes bacterium]|nr:hypothetical protein [Bacteroidota bacterium]
MHIHIHDQTTLREIQEVFSTFYPHLRLRFYQHPHKAFELSSERQRLSEDLTIAECRHTHIDGILDIMPDQRVAQVEDELLKKFGLSAQVLKKEKSEWVQTIGLDSYSLKEVNEFSKNDSDEYLIRDYDAGFEGGVF